MEQKRNRVGTIFFTLHITRASGSCSPEKRKKKKTIYFTRSLRENKSPLLLDQNKRTSNLCQATNQLVMTIYTKDLSKSHE